MKCLAPKRKKHNCSGSNRVGADGEVEARAPAEVVRLRSGRGASACKLITIDPPPTIREQSLVFLSLRRSSWPALRNGDICVPTRLRISVGACCDSKTLSVHPPTQLGVGLQNARCAQETRPRPFLSDTMYLLICFGKSTSPQNRRMIISISNSKQQVNDFDNQLISAFCEINSRAATRLSVSRRGPGGMAIRTSSSPAFGRMV